MGTSPLLSVVNYRNIRCYTDGGRYWPSVHALISLITGKSWIDEDAALRGQHLHACVARHLRGEDPECPALYQPRFNALREWANEADLHPLSIETSMVASAGWAGTPDLVTEDGTIYDWKFAESMRFEYELQAQAYLQFDFPVGSLSPQESGRKFYVIKVDKHNEVTTFPLVWNEECESLLLSAMGIMEYRLKDRRKRSK
jgi:uncharacterized protein YihD (DUF1040 family)